MHSLRMLSERNRSILMVTLSFTSFTFIYTRVLPRIAAQQYGDENKLKW